MDAISKITRPDIEDKSLYGFVLKTSETLMLIAEENDFCMDGYKVLRNRDIAICKSTAATRYGTRMMKKEGLLKDIGRGLHVDISNWANLFSSLERQDKFVIVEDEIQEQFLIGPIQRVKKKSVIVDYFDGTGKWKGPRSLSYRNVTSVTFESRYIRMYRKYIRKA